MKPVIKWSGSKRLQAKKIMEYFPNSYGTYYEPFIGGGSMLYFANPEKSICGDICEPLIELWKMIRDCPSEIADEYEIRWNKLQNDGWKIYYDIRENFNKKNLPQDLLFLSRTCVNGLIRFNNNGDFNNSPHYSRRGIKPESLRKIIFDWSERIKNVEFIFGDYRITTASAKSGDIVYLDPPYFHNKGRYFGTINFESFIKYLEELNDRGIKYILSFDGKRGEKNYTVELPKNLYREHIFLPSGNSTFKNVIDKKTEKVVESLYLNF